MAASAKNPPDLSAPPAPARRPRASAKGEQTRARLIAAARTLLAGGMSERFTTRNVAALCGVSHGMCHYHFQDRTDLVLAVITDIRPEWIHPLEEAVAGPGSFAERAERVVELLSRPEGAELSHLHSALHWHALNDARVRESLEAEYRRWRGCFVALFRVLADERGGDVDPRLLGEAVAAAVDGLAAVESLGAEVDPEPVLRTLIRTLAAGA
ncbi:MULTISPECIES: TetR/AcrR family transcriptional regulator [unclassified Streptomyces]|uniref:TetR/AcrR family transcriptional regulator n=1 Tax=unclassified Streptomyces TaxID=2593676 RepID=UPI002DDB0EB3|nr:TetR/AcrR family transcriptional regulator [Streptomyces sp. NBC_01294]WRZ60774.1 TetR/AcrR family transcriptional regulator [Streptomyces sp. NBC_01294]